MQLQQHPLDAIRMLVDVLDEQDATVDRRQVWRSCQVNERAQVATPQETAGIARWLSRCRDVDTVGIARECRAPMQQRELRNAGRRVGTEIMTRGRASKGRRPMMREHRHLQRGAIAVAAKDFLRTRDQVVVDPVQQSREPVAAARGHHDVDVVAREHPVETLDPFGIGAGEAHVACVDGFVDDDVNVVGPEPLHRSLERGRVRHVSGGRDDPDAAKIHPTHAAWNWSVVIGHLRTSVRRRVAGRRIPKASTRSRVRARRRSPSRDG